MPWNKKKENGKWCVYKEGDAKAVTCHPTEAAANKHLAALYANEANMSTDTGMTVEIFAVGRWNGMEFTLADLQKIAATFAALGDNHKVPLKFGHNNEQPMTDGQPALGWVSDVWVENNKLMAKFSDVPDIVQAAFDKKLYRNVSIELDFDVQYKDTHYPMVLSGVALLGADLPAVNTLKELTHYVGQNAGFSVGYRAMYSAIAGNNQGDNEMDIKELSDKLDKVIDANTKLATENAEMKSKVAAFEASAKASTDAASAAKITAKRKEVTDVLEAAVKSGAILPAQREQFSTLLKLNDDAAVEGIELDAVKALVNTGKKAFSKEQGTSGNNKEQSAKSPDAQIADAIQEILAKGEAADFSTAQQMVFRRDPELARAYVTYNDKKE